MIPTASQCSLRPTGRPPSRWRAARAAGLAAALACGLLAGCRRGDAPPAPPRVDPQTGKPVEAVKDPFQFGVFTLRPAEIDRVEASIKPGHWVGASLELRSNHGDFLGELSTELLGETGEGVDLDGVPFRLRCIRPAVLPKEQKKTLDCTLFQPIESPSRQAAPRLLSAPGGREVFASRELLTPMPDHQWFFVVLSRAPDSYRFLHTLDSVWAPTGSISDRGAQANYRVLLPKVNQSAPLPERTLCWTTTAVVLWDDLDASLLSAAQRQSLLDWLHWGGQLIVSGPDSLTSLRGTFLEPLLPAASDGTLEIAEAHVGELNRTWTSQGDRLRIARPWTGEKLVVQPAAETLIASDDGQPLIVERRAGHGRVVVTAFRLTQSELVAWPGFDGLFNACLLRRAPRRFSKSPEFEVSVGWQNGPRFSPRANSKLWYFSRDAGRPARRRPTNPVGAIGWSPSIDGDQADAAMPAPGPGVAAWDDSSEVAVLAREALREATGIQVPSALFVACVLAAYLLVLVPLNWLIFSWLGRVEMAWLAAPIISIVFGVLVVNLAQLNIGFARSTTELGVLEIQADYPRAHLTRYHALYTSLSTDYTLAFADPSAVALPFRTGVELLARQNRGTVVLSSQPETASGEQPEGVRVALEQLEVASNSTGMTHSEEMFDLGGRVVCAPLGSDRYRVTNGSSVRLRDAVLVSTAGSAELGTLEPGAGAEIQLLSRTREDQAARHWNAVPQFQALDPRPLLDLAATDLAPGGLRMVGWTDDELPGLKITPRASQVRRMAVVVAHLRQATPPAPQTDVSSRSEVAQMLRTAPQPNESYIDETVPVPP